MRSEAGISSINGGSRSSADKIREATPATSPCTRHGCAECCYETEMPLMESDIWRIEAAGARRQDFVTIDADGTSILTNVEDRGRRHCVFLKNDRCSIYPARPEGCRTYPFILDERLRAHRDVDCPHRSEFPADPEVEGRLRLVLSTVLAEGQGRMQKR
ncbi:MAG: YkgJ family cysteine cluster protein [Thermoplasmatota archaeon]